MGMICWRDDEVKNVYFFNLSLFFFLLFENSLNASSWEPYSKYKFNKA